ncbi:MAG: exonuclease [Flavobacteriaceae bacterium]|jgi:DNA polymerase-3 subunit epsilon|nr:exonuclease [Flavobacteriaceae bacterium]
MDYAILDVETTGGKYNEEGIIEIAVYRFDGEKITDTFISLVNPEKEIHFYVQKLTGITKKMVKTAPKFYELAKRLVEITDNAVLVGHNVTFDYRVIRAEFSRLGFDFQRPTLDTITLSKNLIPDVDSYSLGKLCISLGIPLSDRHRAHGDARATVKLFQLLLAKDTHKNIIQSFIKQIKHSSLNKKILLLLEGLPQETGVFYFHDEKGKIIYIDNSSNISNKIRQLFTGKSQRLWSLREKTENISFELTGNEIIAAIKVQNEVKLNHPDFKPVSKPSSSTYGIFIEPIKNKLFIAPVRAKNKKSALLTFSSQEKALAFLSEKEKDFALTKNDSLQQFISELGLKEKNLLLTDTGRKLGEKSFLFFENGVLQGYGFYSLHSQIKSIDRIRKIMIPSRAGHDILLQIRNKLFVNKKLKKIIIE